jgi:hypothetical protein
MSAARRVLAALALVAALAAPSRAADVYAVVVGYNGARDGLPTLRFADDDAVRFSLLLAGLAEGRAERVRLLATLDADTARGLERAGLRATPAGPPTRAALRAAFDDVARALAARPAGAAPPTFYFVYAGHGLRGRILLEPEAGADAALTGHELRAAVAELARAAPGLRAYVFLDACRSQSLFTERGEVDAGPGPDLSAEVNALEARTEAARIGVLTAAFSGHAAGEVKALGAGYFSHVLASGLAGAADADGDRLVSFAELAAFVAYNTDRLGAQRPWFSPPDGDLAATTVDLRGARTLLELSAAPAGRYLVEAASGRPILAEAVKGERPLRLALPAGRYRVLRTSGREPARAAEVELVANAPLDLARSAWTEAPTLARGGDEAEPAAADEPAAFASAFGPEAVATLRAAFDAGREPAHAPRDARHAVSLAATVAGAPLSLGGVELGASARYRRRLGRAFVGADASFGRSSHDAPAAYRLDRWLALVEGGARWAPLGERLELSLVAAAGGGPVLRRGAGGALSGDVFAPAVAAGGGLEWRVEGRWSLVVDARWALQAVSVDGARRRSSSAGVRAGVSWAF